MTLAGMVAGLLAAFLLTRVLASLLYEVKPEDPMTYLVVSGLLLSVGLLAAWIPARRIVSLDPARSLRSE